MATNGISMHVAEQGNGPPIVLCHGFPELWYSWRHQLAALSAAGYHAIAPDQRGDGQTDRPSAIDAYDIVNLPEAGHWVQQERPDESTLSCWRSSPRSAGSARLPVIAAG